MVKDRSKRSKGRKIPYKTGEARTTRQERGRETLNVGEWGGVEEGDWVFQLPVRGCDGSGWCGGVNGINPLLVSQVAEVMVLNEKAK